MISTTEYLELKNYKAPTSTDYESAIAKLVADKVELEIKLSEIKEIVSTYEFTEPFKLALIKKVLRWIYTNPTTTYPIASLSME